MAALKYKVARAYLLSLPDLIVAATALHHGLTVVSRDVSDPLPTHTSAG
jgi:predicted nucleic acid-binding protein